LRTDGATDHTFLRNVSIATDAERAQLLNSLWYMDYPGFYNISQLRRSLWFVEIGLNTNPETLSPYIDLHQEIHVFQ